MSCPAKAHMRVGEGWVAGQKIYIFVSPHGVSRGTADRSLAVELPIGVTVLQMVRSW